jgi:hypothetical protein
MGGFLSFCKNMTYKTIPPDVMTDSIEVEESIAKKIDVISEDILLRIENIEKVHIPYIEAAFDDMHAAFSKIQDNDIPDEILNRFAVNIFGEPFNQLSNVERSIIAVLSVYILI